MIGERVVLVAVRVGQRLPGRPGEPLLRRPARPARPLLTLPLMLVFSIEQTPVAPVVQLPPPLAPADQLPSTVTPATACSEAS